MTDRPPNSSRPASRRRPTRAPILGDDAPEDIEADDLSGDQVAELEIILGEMLVSIQRSLDISAAGAKAVDLEEPIGRVSRIDAIQQQKMIQAQRSRLVVRLDQVKASLAKIADDSYGCCNRCDDPIGYPRLKSKPESPLCLRCQRELEKR